MAKLIDLDKLGLVTYDEKKLAETLHIEGKRSGKLVLIALDIIYHFLAKAPTIDPVHAAGGIYCRECENYWKNNNGKGFYGCTTVGDDDFCSNGTRRKEDGTPD